MRRNENDVKTELLKRKDRYFAKKAIIRKRVIAAVLCLCMVAATLAVVFTVPKDKDTEDNVIETPFDSSAADSRPDSESFDVISKEDSFADASVDESEDTSEEGNNPDQSQDISGEESVDYSEDTSVQEPSVDASGDGGGVEDLPTTEESGDVDVVPGYGDVKPGYEDIEPEYEFELVYPEMPSDGSSTNLLHTLTVTKPNNVVVNNPFAAVYNDFAAKLFKGCAEGEDNTLISPLSVMLALSMMANGADTETKEAMEKALGGIPIEYFNKCISNYVESLPSTKTASLSIGNSVWIKDGFGVNKGFLQCLADYYQADSFMAPFTDKTADELNAWIDENTDGTIKNMLDYIPPDAVLLMVNALVFDAEWNYKFTIDPDQEERPFTNADGSKTDVMYLSDSCLPGDYDTDADVKYIETSTARGIVKKYKDGYSFVALLPNDKDGLNALIASLTGKQISSMISGAKVTNIRYSFPAFCFNSGVSSETLQKTLTEMGMGVAFDPTKADFTNINESGVFIGQILHSTFIEVNNIGTKAGAATIIIAPPTGGGPVYEEVISFDRPFVYMIVEDTYDTPIFMGKATDMSKSQVDITHSVIEKELSERWDYEVLEYSAIDENSAYNGEAYTAYPVDYALINSKEELDSYIASKAPWAMVDTEIDYSRNYAAVITVREPNASVKFSIESVCQTEGRNGKTLNIELSEYLCDVGSGVDTGYAVDYLIVVAVDRYYAADKVKTTISGFRDEIAELDEDNADVYVELYYGGNFLGDFSSVGSLLPSPVIIGSVEELDAYFEQYFDVLNTGGRGDWLKNYCKTYYTEAFFRYKVLLLVAFDEKHNWDPSLNVVKTNGEARLELTVDYNDYEGSPGVNFLRGTVNRFYLAYGDDFEVVFE